MSEVSLRELECFIAVAEELSFTQAATRLHMAQPPLSRHIAALEDKLGVRLFDRTKRSVNLTSAGRAFLTEAREILPKLERACETAKRAGRGETDRLSVGFVSAVLSPELSQIFASFRRLHTDIQLQLQDCLPAAQLDAIARGEIDLGFIGVEPDTLPSNVTISLWKEEALLAFLPPDHPLNRKPEVALSELAGEPFAVVADEAAPAFAKLIRDICRDAGFRPRVVHRSPRAQAVAATTIAGSAVAILPESMNRVTENGRPLVAQSGEPLRIRHVIAHRHEPEPAVQRFLELLHPAG